MDPDPKYNKEYIYDTKKFDIWFCSKGLQFDNNMNDTLGSLFSNNITYLNNLGNITLENISSEDGLPSSGCYQMSEFLDIPASAYIFSKYNYPNKCKINADYNYESLSYYVNDCFTTIPEGEQNVLSPFNNYDIKSLEQLPDSEKQYIDSNEQYFMSDYGFNEKYDPTEYVIYNIPKKLLIEDQTNATVTNGNFNIPMINVIGGALLVTWSDESKQKIYNYNSQLMTKDQVVEKLSESNPEITQSDIELELNKLPVAYESFPVNSANCIPVSYTELPRIYNLKNTKLNIQWSEDGIFSLK